MMFATTSFSLKPSSPARTRSISQAQRGIVKILRDIDVGDAAKSCGFPPPDRAPSVAGFHVGTADLHVDGRLHAQIQHGVHQAAGREEDRQAGQFALHSAL